MKGHFYIDVPRLRRLRQVFNGLPGYSNEQNYRGDVQVRAGMKELTDPRWIKAKGILFLFLGLFAAALLLWEHPSIRAVFLLAITIWAFCRAYYFAFYVIERYVDPSFRFSGLWSAIRFMRRRKQSSPAPAPHPAGDAPGDRG